jgi:hypothetical protein
MKNILTCTALCVLGHSDTKKIVVAAIGTAASLVINAHGADLRVPQDYPSIQRAIDAATNGDSIIVGPGMYEEVIRFGGRAVTVRSSAGASATMIARPVLAPSSPVVTFDFGETSASVLSGFTISRGTGVFTDIFGCNCDGYQLGGGVFVSGASPVIQDCVIANNACGTYFSRGGGVYVGSGAPTFERCIIRDNQANGGYGSGGGIHVAGGSPKFLDCTVKNCSVQSYHSGNCGGIAAGGSPYFSNCRITGNSASGGVGGLCVGPSAILERVYVGSVNGATPISGDFSDAGGNALTGDCNGNGVADHSDIAGGISLDLDADGMPDECICRHYPINCCPGDLNANSVVDGADLGALLAFWGPVTTFPRADINQDGRVSGADLGYLLNSWGPCPN